VIRSLAIDQSGMSPRILPGQTKTPSDLVERRECASGNRGAHDALRQHSNLATELMFNQWRVTASRWRALRSVQPLINES
jgi:hypothetical protein